MSSENILSHSDNNNIIYITFENNSIKITLINLETDKIIKKIYDSRQCDTLEKIEMKTIFNSVLKYSINSHQFTINNNKIIFYAYNNEDTDKFK
jgi:hypothetical protein